MPERPTLFVYGSLRRGGLANALLEDADYLGPASTAPSYTLLHLGGYPGLVAGGTTAVVGELYRVPRDTMLRLDEYEGHPESFRRSSIALDDGRAVLGYLYVGRRTHTAPAIPGGDWLEPRHG